MKAEAKVVSVESPKSQLKFRKPWLMAGLAILLVLCIVAVVVTVYPSSFKTITYNNGQGSSFRLKFYSKYYDSYSYTSTSSANPKQKQSGYQNSLVGLASKVSLNKEYPIWLGIYVTVPAASLQSQYSSSSSNLCSGQPTLLTVSNPGLNLHIPFCKFGLINDRQAYTGSFMYKHKLYSIIVTQVASNKQTADPNDTTLIGLTAYQSDLQTIIASIKPL